MTERVIYDLVFLRHGESVGNAESRWQGQADCPLTDTGREQSQALAERWLREKRRFDRILSSPLRRAKDTADILGNTLNLPVETDSIWMERNIGEVEGMTSEEVDQRFPKHEFITPYSSIIGGEGEGDWELYLRGGQALQGLLNRKSGKYLVISHGGLLNQVMCAIVGVTPHANFSGPRFRLSNTGFTHVKYFPESHRWHIEVVNDRAHWNGKDSD